MPGPRGGPWWRVHSNPDICQTQRLQLYLIIVNTSIFYQFRTKSISLMKLAVENKAKRVKISNIEFAINNKLKAPSSKTATFKNQTLIDELDTKVQLREGAITRNSFIPRTGIKSQNRLDNPRKGRVEPLHPASLTYSMFPQRKPISAKTARTLLPIFRQRIFSFCNQQDIDIDIDKTKLHSSPVQKIRTKTASCLVLKSSKTSEKEMNRLTKSSRGDRRIHSFKTNDDRWQTMQKLYL